MCPAAASITMPSGYLHSVTMTLWSEPSGFSETTHSSLRSRRNRRPTMAVSPDARCGFCICDLTMCTPGNQLGYERDAGFTPVRSNSIVERAAAVVDVTVDSDRQRRLSAVTLPQRVWKTPMVDAPI